MNIIKFQQILIFLWVYVLHTINITLDFQAALLQEKILDLEKRLEEATKSRSKMTSIEKQLEVLVFL